MGFLLENTSPRKGMSSGSHAGQLEGLTKILDLSHSVPIDHDKYNQAAGSPIPEPEKLK
jgi:hypothetical protein